ncbi:hypothetical protein AMTR_s00062p00116610 [Amborella trichopoda]|uniref:Uncharacterized protein n=1 Tax=Amborella trichopoda TaxID=13333 RepID=U5DGQ0_AMBTC|nr:hypothetical protein AMTR_s00062p00116610 [Amborella trichopoda]
MKQALTAAWLDSNISFLWFRYGVCRGSSNNIAYHTLSQNCSALQRTNLGCRKVCRKPFRAVEKPVGRMGFSKESSQASERAHKRI